MLRRGWMLTLALATSSCAPPVMPRQAFLDRTLSAKAAFDLQCPKEQLQYVDLGGSPVHGRYVYNGRPTVDVGDQLFLLDGQLNQQQGVSGCGRRASYAYANGAWIGNGASNEAAPGGK